MVSYGKAGKGAELIRTSGVLAVNDTAGPDDVVLVLENFSCVVVEAYGEVRGGVVRNDVFVVYNTVSVRS